MQTKLFYIIIVIFIIGVYFVLVVYAKELTTLSSGETNRNVTFASGGGLD